MSPTPTLTYGLSVAKSFMVLSFGLGAGLAECTKSECNLLEVQGPVYFFYVGFGLLAIFLLVLILGGIQSYGIRPNLTKVVQKAARSHVERGVLFRLETKELPYRQYFGLHGDTKIWIDVDIDIEAAVNNDSDRTLKL